MKNALTTAMDNDQVEYLTLADLWHTVLRRKIFIGVVTLAFVLLGLFYYLTAPRIYQASAVVLLETQKTDVQIKAVLTTEANDQMLIPSEIQVLQSRELMGKVVDTLGLLENPTLLSKNPNWKAKRTLQGSEKEIAAARNGMIDYALSGLKVAQIEHSRAIEVSYRARNPQISADIVNTLTKLYIEQQLSSNFEAIKMTNEWLAARVAETQKKMMEANAKVAQYRKESGIVDSRGEGLIEQNLSDLSAKLVTANASVADLEARLNGFGEGRAMDSAPEVLASPLIQRLKENQASARDELAALQNQLGPSHPKVKTARAQVAEINGKIADETRKLAEGLRREYQAAQDNVTNIQKQMDELRNQYNDSNSSNVELQALIAEAETSRAFLDTLNLRFKETQSQQDGQFQPPYARIISPAPVPTGPSSPKGKLVLLASLLIGLALGSGLALAMDMVQHGVYNGKQLQGLTGMTNLSVVPKAALNPDKGIVTYADYPVQGPLTPFTQSIRTLATSVRLELGKKPDAKIFNFTSSQAGEGKSSVVVALTRQLSLQGLKVLAIDGDIRQPTLTNTFGLMQKPGLSELLSGASRVEDVMFKDTQSGAMLVGAGRVMDMNITSRDLNEWKKLLDTVSQGFDIVLMDSPPVVSFPEGKLIAKLSRNILCVRWKKTSIKLLNFAIDTLDRLGVETLGTVITISNPKQNFVRDDYRD